MRRAAVIVLLVLISVAGYFLLAGILNTREAAARMKCVSNLKGIALSLHNYASTNTYLPHATLPNAGLAPEERLSWLVTIVPYVESDNLHSRMNLEKGWEAEENHFAALLKVRYLVCPDFPHRRPTSTVVTHYLGVAGLGPDAAMLPLDHPRAGFFGHERKLKLENIASGMSTLMAATETTHQNGCWTAGGFPTVRGLDDDGLPLLGRDGQFGGLHRIGANVVFADGSVRFWRDSLDHKIIKAMACIRGREDVGPIGDE